MKYFEIIDTPELKYAPRPERWYGKIDVRDIGIRTFPRLPKRQLLTVEPSEKTIFTDFVLFPFLLLSPRVVDVIRMYREVCFCRDVILLDQISGESELYYLSVFDETDKLLVREKQGFQSGKQIEVDKHIFWVRNSLKRHTIISLDLAESLFRRGITGLGVREVELALNEKENAQR